MVIQENGRVMEQHSDSVPTNHDGRAQASVRALIPIVGEPEPRDSSRKVAFDVKEDEYEEEVNKHLQWRCVCLASVIS